MSKTTIDTINIYCQLSHKQYLVSDLLTNKVVVKMSLVVTYKHDCADKNRPYLL